MRYFTFQSMPLVLEVRDIADTLQIGRNQAYKLISTGEIKAVKVGNQYRIPRESFIEFLLGDKKKE